MIAVDRAPRLCFACDLRRLIRGRNVLRLGAAEVPDFIALDVLRPQSANTLVIVGGACVDRAYQKLRDCVDRYPSHAGVRPHGRVLNRHV